jgi:hypothetical protein
MMYTPKFELSGFSTLPPNRKETVLNGFLEALICANWNYIIDEERKGRPVPSIYDCLAPNAYVLKVRPMGLDSWQDIPTTIQLGSGDCKDFAAWRVAELRHAGYNDVACFIKPSVHPDPKGIEPDMTVYHIQVRVYDVIEDPSALLGMPTNVTYDQLRA